MCQEECECCCGHRHYLTKEEEIEKLESHKRNLEAEIKGIERKLEEIKREA
jgi:hypothetical protein